MILFEPHCSITKFNKKKCLVLHASSTVIPALLKGDLISIPHFSSVFEGDNSVNAGSQVCFLLRQQ